MRVRRYTRVLGRGHTLESGLESHTVDLCSRVRWKCPGVPKSDIERLETKPLSLSLSRYEETTNISLCESVQVPARRRGVAADSGEPAVAGLCVGDLRVLRDGARGARLGRGRGRLEAAHLVLGRARAPQTAQRARGRARARALGLLGARVLSERRHSHKKYLFPTSLLRRGRKK